MLRIIVIGVQKRTASVIHAGIAPTFDTVANAVKKDGKELVV